MIFVVLGSQKFPFDRLVKAADELAAAGKEVFIQRGASGYVPQHCLSEAFMDTERFEAAMREADVVITHGGTGAIIKAVKMGKKVIVVPRLAQYGEHVDDHQKEIVSMFAGLELALPCNDLAQLPQLVAQVQEMTFRSYRSNTQTIIDDIDGYIQQIVK